ncbi:MAG: acyl-CoA dehydrogenase C-terminal domain-containing protein, partial [Candidatus Puniceispirillaceae bacterium]
RSGHIAASGSADGFSPAFLEAKQVTADIYLHQCLPEIDALARKIMAGGTPVLAMDPDWLTRH